MRLALVATILALLIVWEYATAFRGGFVYEDYRTTDACTGDRLAVGRMLTLGSWCWQIDRGHAPQSFRVVSLGLHLSVTALVGALAWTVTREAVPALLAAAFFGLNSVQVESVAYLTSRGELIAALGVVGACVAAVHRWWMLAATLLVFGWLGKESASVAVMLVPLTLWYQRRHIGWLLTAGAGAVALEVGILMQTPAWWQYMRDTPTSWALTQVTAIARVTTLSVLPFWQTVDYDYTGVPWAVAVVAIVVALAWAARHSRLVACGAAWVACAVAPRLIVPTPQSVFNEHQFYLPLVGMALILAGLTRGDTA